MPNHRSRGSINSSSIDLKLWDGIGPVWLAQSSAHIYMIAEPCYLGHGQACQTLVTTSDIQALRPLESMWQSCMNRSTAKFPTNRSTGSQSASKRQR